MSTKVSDMNIYGINGVVKNSLFEESSHVMSDLKSSVVK